MAQRESVLSKRIAAELKKQLGFDLFVFKVWGSAHMMAGLPDLIGCYRGRFFGLEVKHPETRSNQSERQLLVQGWIRQAVGLSEVVTSPKEAVDALRTLD